MMTMTVTQQSVKLVYFAWVRERIGRAEEHLDVPISVTTVADLVDWLTGLDDRYARAFADRRQIRCAVDKRHAKPDHPIAHAREIAFFPPVTGG
jgi:molybdopterin synthase sulfur carrier subunit